MELEETIEIASPYDIRHFYLDIPDIKDSLKKDAVSYAIRSLYPYNKDTTRIDFASFGKKTLAFVVEKSKLDYLSNNRILISPVLLLSLLTVNGKSFFICRDFLLEVINENGILKDFEFCRVSEAEAFFAEHYDANDKAEGTCFYCFKREKNYVELLLPEDAKISFLEEKLNKRIFKRAGIFSEKENYSGKKFYRPRFLYWVCLATLFCAGLIFCMKIKHQADLSDSELAAKKAEYDTLKESIRLAAPIESNQSEVSDLSIHETISIYNLLEEIYAASPAIKISSLMFSNREFRLEAEVENGLKFYNRLSESFLIKELKLHQVTQKSDKIERIIISGFLND